MAMLTSVYFFFIWTKLIWNFVHNLFKFSEERNFLCGFVFVNITHHCMLKFCISKVVHFIHMQCFQATHYKFEISTIRHLTLQLQNPSWYLLFHGHPKLPWKPVPTLVLCALKTLCVAFLDKSNFKSSNLCQMYKFI